MLVYAECPWNESNIWKKNLQLLLSTNDQLDCCFAVSLLKLNVSLSCHSLCLCIRGGWTHLETLLWMTSPSFQGAATQSPRSTLLVINIVTWTSLYLLMHAYLDYWNLLHCNGYWLINHSILFKGFCQWRIKRSGIKPLFGLLIRFVHSSISS